MVVLERIDATPKSRGFAERTPNYILGRQPRLSRSLEEPNIW
jgi:hypothetical protein